MIDVLKPILLIVHLVIQEVGVDVAAKWVISNEACSDFDVLFQILNNLRVDELRRFWIVYPEIDKEMCGTEGVMEQERTGVKILFQMSHNF